MNQEPVLLRMEGICKEFPGVKALDGVNLTVKAGTVHALMGENGAGAIHPALFNQARRGVVSFTAASVSEQSGSFPAC